MKLFLANSVWTWSDPKSLIKNWQWRERIHEHQTLKTKQIIEQYLKIYRNKFRKSSHMLLSLLPLLLLLFYSTCWNGLFQFRLSVFFSSLPRVHVRTVLLKTLEHRWPFPFDKFSDACRVDIKNGILLVLSECFFISCTFRKSFWIFRSVRKLQFLALEFI